MRSNKPYQPGHKGRPPKDPHAQRSLADHKLSKAIKQIDEARAAIKKANDKEGTK